MLKFLFFFIFLPNIVLAQMGEYNIKGDFGKDNANKFAYLHLSQIDDRSEELIAIPINNNQFFINKQIDKKKRLCIFGIIFTSKRGDITIDEFNEMKKDMDFYLNHKLLIVLEDSVHIDFKSPITQSIVNGGKLTNESVLCQKATKDNTYLEFIISHPDSPFSLLCLKAINRIKNMSIYTKNLENINTSELFNKLSDRLKQSFEGKEYTKEYQ
ncbi:hypothetical protein [Pedobacter nototheniae]|uniref:hypothetical protein n=1 Tax=Pedobacter nototheniae TaxID=2488994 RepID=UPI00103B35C5|nr:hypothetical protein [Pedobacter nototheniae]